MGLSEQHPLALDLILLLLLLLLSLLPHTSGLGARGAWVDPVWCCPL
jgi:hypothetical protein